jgi:hypothetical protein
MTADQRGVTIGATAPASADAEPVGIPASAGAVPAPPAPGPAGVSPRRVDWSRSPLARHGEELFAAPGRADGPGGRRRWRGWLLALAVLVAGTVAGLLRQPGAGALDTVWAEDGSVFLGGAEDGSFPAALVRPYAGYLHLGPRLLAELAALTPVSRAAAVLAVGAALVTAALALAVYAASAAHLRSTLLRVVAAAPVVALPLAQEELPNAVANLHWPALYATFWMLVWNPPQRSRQAAAALVVGLTAASDLLCGVFVPLAVARAVSVPGRRGKLVPLALAGGLVLQLGARIFAESSRELTPNPNPVWAGAAYVLRTVPLALVGERWLGADVDPSARYLALVLVAWLLVAAVVAAAVRRRLPFPAWTLAVVAAAHSAVLFGASAMLSGLVVPRYSAAPAMLLVAALAALLRPGPQPGPGGAGPAFVPAAGSAASRWGPAAFAGVLLLVAVVNFRVDNPRADGPRWSDSVRDARVSCQAAQGAPAAVEVPISPAADRWTARLPCTALR